MYLPPLPLLDPLSVGDEEMGFTTVRAQQTSLPKWGLRHMPHRAVATVGRDYLLGPRLIWTVEENKESLGGTEGGDQGEGPPAICFMGWPHDFSSAMGPVRTMNRLSETVPAQAGGHDHRETSQGTKTRSG